jgi:hypothetical protein
MDRLTYEELIETLNDIQAAAIAIGWSYVKTIHDRRVEIYPCGFRIYEYGDEVTSRPVGADLAAVLLETL